MLPNIIPDQVAPAYATLRLVGFVRGLSQRDADEVTLLAIEDSGVAITGILSEGDYGVSAFWVSSSSPSLFNDDDE